MVASKNDMTDTVVSVHFARTRHLNVKTNPRTVPAGAAVEGKIIKLEDVA